MMMCRDVAVLSLDIRKCLAHFHKHVHIVTAVCVCVCVRCVCCPIDNLIIFNEDKHSQGCLSANYLVNVKMKM